MNDLNKFKDVCELLKIWHYIKTNNLVWTQATSALEVRINLLLDESGYFKTPLGREPEHE